jgi:hypothetical protein
MRYQTCARQRNPSASMGDRSTHCGRRVSVRARANMGSRSLRGAVGRACQGVRFSPRRKDLARAASYYAALFSPRLPIRVHGLAAQCGQVWVRNPFLKSCRISEACPRPSQKTGQVLVRTPGSRKPWISAARRDYVRRSEVIDWMVARVGIEPTTRGFPEGRVDDLSSPNDSESKPWRCPSDAMRHNRC